MKTQTSTLPPVIPIGYNKMTFNKWQKYLQKQLDRINKTTVSQRLVA